MDEDDNYDWILRGNRYRQAANVANSRVTAEDLAEEAITAYSFVMSDRHASNAHRIQAANGQRMMSQTLERWQRMRGRPANAGAQQSSQNKNNNH